MKDTHSSQHLSPLYWYNTLFGFKTELKYLPLLFIIRPDRREECFDLIAIIHCLTLNAVNGFLAINPGMDVCVCVGGGGGLPYISRTKDMVLEPYWSEKWYGFQPFWSEIGYGCFDKN